MKNCIKVSLFSFLAFIFVMGCSGEKKTETAKEMHTHGEKILDVTPDMLTTTTDLICGMDLTKHAITDTVIYEGQLYGFCSEYCKNKFLENPEEALKKLESTAK